MGEVKLINETYHLWAKDEYTYPVMGQFIPNVVTYIHEEDDCKRPAMIVVPGGGYTFVSPTEGELVAKEFYRKGYNAFVVSYTTNLLKTSPLKLQPLKDLSKAVMFVRKRAEQFNIDPKKVAVCGFSAGGHLCGSLAVHHDANELEIDGEYEGINNRPDAVILSYPVISSGEFGHKDSFIALFGSDATQEELEYMSLEKHVTKETPPTFIWHTATDELVPVENSCLFASACKEQGVIFEHHVFANGKHGLSLANEDWASGDYGGDYTFQQLYDTIQYFVDNGIELPDPFKMFGAIPEGASVQDGIKQGMQQFAQQQINHPDQGIAVWPELANNWIRKLFGI
jgi:acetyl esterase/lipase